MLPRLQPLTRDAAALAAHGSPMRSNVQRKAAITRCGPSDHVGAVVPVQDDSFDLDITIFQPLDGKLERFVTKLY